MKKKAMEQAKSKPAAKFFHKGEWFDILEVKEYNKDELNALQQCILKVWLICMHLVRLKLVSTSTMLMRRVSSFRLSILRAQKEW